MSISAMLMACGGSAKSLGWNSDTLAGELGSVDKLPPVPEGVTQLKFSELFRNPVGPRGLEFTDTAKRLDGQRVRILGFMVKQVRPSPGVSILAPYSFVTHEGEYGLCDDLPPATIFVEVPKYRDIAVPFTPGPLLLSGKLEIGRREESDGRVSFVRLFLDAESATPDTAAQTQGRGPVAAFDSVGASATQP